CGGVRQRALRHLSRVDRDAGQPAPGHAGRGIDMAALLIDMRIALMNLVEHRRRSAFLGIAIALVTALFVLLTALSIGLRDTLIETATTLSTGHLNVGGFFKITSGQAAPV